jgi:plastocyanin
MSTKTRVALLCLVPGALLAAACGGAYSSPGGGSAAGNGNGFYLTISGMAFAPLELSVPAGATVTVLNRDSMAHSVTSEVGAGQFKPGAVSGVSFDTKAFTGTATFTIPAGAQDGTVIPYYCSTHLGAMATPTGTIRIAAEAQPAPPPGGTPRGY